jgi:hypothetical protein
MAKTILISILLLGYYFGLGNTILNTECQTCIINTYTSQLGVREATGRNDGPEVEAYLASVGFTKGAPWCAAFTHWVLLQCQAARVRSAWSPSWFPNSRVILGKSKGKQDVEVVAGDVFGIYFPARKRIAHVGFIHECKSNENYCYTVEGNTNQAGSREGDGVYKKRRLKSQIYKVSRWLD